MSKSKYVCKEPCPVCGARVEIFGSECYPEDGIQFECTKDGCDYSGELSCSKRFDCLLEATKIAHDTISKKAKG